MDTEFAVHPTIKLEDASGEKSDLLKDYEELRGIEEAGESKVFVKELKAYFPINDWLDGVEDKFTRHRKQDQLETTIQIRNTKPWCKIPA